MKLTKRPEYEIQLDTKGVFETGQILPDSRYNSVKEEYEIRLKDWPGDIRQTGEGIVHISGRKRDLIKGFLEEKRYVITSEFYHYQVRARGKSVDPQVISAKIQEMGLKFLWVHVIGETGPDSGREKRRSR